MKNTIHVVNPFASAVYTPDELEAFTAVLRSKPDVGAISSDDMRVELEKSAPALAAKLTDGLFAQIAQDAGMKFYFTVSPDSSTEVKPNGTGNGG